jgi:hypothetical protein
MAMDLQKWNNVFTFIKLYLGADINQLELDEFKMKEIVEAITLPTFSNYINYVDYFELYSSSTCITEFPGPTY